MSQLESREVHLLNTNWYDTSREFGPEDRLSDSGERNLNLVGTFEDKLLRVRFFFKRALRAYCKRGLPGKKLQDAYRKCLTSLDADRLGIHTVLGKLDDVKEFDDFLLSLYSDPEHRDLLTTAISLERKKTLASSDEVGSEIQIVSEMAPKSACLTIESGIFHCKQVATFVFRYFSNLESGYELNNQDFEDIVGQIRGHALGLRVAMGEINENLSIYDCFDEFCLEAELFLLNPYEYTANRFDKIATLHDAVRAHFSRMEFKDEIPPSLSPARMSSHRPPASPEVSVSPQVPAETSAFNSVADLTLEIGGKLQM